MVRVTVTEKGQIEISSNDVTFILSDAVNFSRFHAHISPIVCTMFLTFSTNDVRSYTVTILFWQKSVSVITFFIKYSIPSVNYNNSERNWGKFLSLRDDTRYREFFGELFSGLGNRFLTVKRYYVQAKLGNFPNTFSCLFENESNHLWSRTTRRQWLGESN